MNFNAIYDTMIEFRNRSVFKSHQLVNTPLTLMSKGGFVLMKISLYRGEESKRRMAQQTLDKTTR